MKKILFSACVAITLVSAALAQDKKEEVKPSYRELGSVLPPMRVIDTLKHEYSESAFQDKNHFFLFLFNPTCGHCIKMAKLVSDNHEVFKNNRVLFLAGPAMMSYMASFYQASGVGSHPEIKVGIDSASVVDRLYNYETLPQINIYDKDRKLIHILHGDVSLDSLKQYIP